MWTTLYTKSDSNVTQLHINTLQQFTATVMRSDNDAQSLSMKTDGHHPKVSFGIRFGRIWYWCWSQTWGYYNCLKPFYFQLFFSSSIFTYLYLNCLQAYRPEEYNGEEHNGYTLAVLTNTIGQYVRTTVKFCLTKYFTNVEMYPK